MKRTRGKGKIIKTDVVKINRIASDIALSVQEKISALEDTKVSIPSGSFTGIPYLVATGPDVNIKVILGGNVETNIKSELTASRNKSNNT
jgi:hypothetical protein